MRYVSLRVWHPDCWMLELSDRHRDVCVESRGVCHHRDTVQAGALIRGVDHAALQAALASQVPADVRREILHVEGAEAEVYSRYPSYRSMYGATMASGFLLQGPVIHENGHERWEVLAEAEGLQEGIARLREVAEVRVERIRETRPPATPSVGLATRLPHGLTERQHEVLRRAVEEGYYGWPRRMNLTRLAREMGISPATALEHLRRAEGLLVPLALEGIPKRERAPER